MNRIESMFLGAVAKISPTFGRIIESASETGELRESLQTLENMMIEDVDWIRQIGRFGMEFSRSGLEAIIRLSRVLMLKNPLIRRAVLLQRFYVFGRGVVIRSEDDTINKALQDFLVRNRKTLGKAALAQSEQDLQTDGNLFFACFTDRMATGAVNVRMIEPLEITEIVTNPEDKTEVWFYRRCYVEQGFDPRTGTVQGKAVECWYPDIDHKPESQPPLIGGKPVHWDAPVLHMKAGGLSSMLFGVPETYSAHDWARSYKDFLSDWTTIQRGLARVLRHVKTSGGAQSVNAIQTALETTYGSASPERNPAPVTGSTIVSGKGVDISNIKTQGVATAPEEARRIGLMVGSGTGTPETMLFMDASVGSYATSKSLDRPTELKFLERQSQWDDTLTRLCVFALNAAVRAPGGGLREAKASIRTEADLQLLVEFPPILEHDVKNEVDAIVEAVTLAGRKPMGVLDRKRIATLILRALNVDDRDAIIDELFGDGYDAEGDLASQMTAPEPEDEPGAMSKAAEAIRELRYEVMKTGGK